MSYALGTSFAYTLGEIDDSERMIELKFILESLGLGVVIFNRGINHTPLLGTLRSYSGFVGVSRCVTIDPTWP